MAAIDKVKILVLGDSGVGKTSLTHLIAHNEAIASPGWTVGCSVEVKLHEFREGYPQQKSVFVELWDVGGSSSHRNARNIFYNPVHGVLLVHDLTNSKSQRNLNKWLTEVLAHESGGKSPADLDQEMMLGSSQMPVLVVGTKLDLADVRDGRSGRGLTFAEEVGADELTLDCRMPRALAAGSSAACTLFSWKYTDVKRSTVYYCDSGKVGSQCAHAAVACYKEMLARNPKLVAQWEAQGQPKIVLRAQQKGEHALTSLADSAANRGVTAVIVRDAGKTQVVSGTATVVGVGPDNAETIAELTRHYRLL